VVYQGIMHETVPAFYVASVVGIENDRLGADKGVFRNYPQQSHQALIRDLAPRSMEINDLHHLNKLFIAEDKLDAKAVRFLFNPAGVFNKVHYYFIHGKDREFRHPDILAVILQPRQNAATSSRQKKL